MVVRSVGRKGPAHLPTADISRIDEIVIQVVLTDYLQNFTKERNAERDAIGINAC